MAVKRNGRREGFSNRQLWIVCATFIVDAVATLSLFQTRHFLARHWTIPAGLFAAGLLVLLIVGIRSKQHFDQHESTWSWLYVTALSGLLVGAFWRLATTLAR